MEGGSGAGGSGGGAGGGGGGAGGAAGQAAVAADGAILWLPASSLPKVMEDGNRGDGGGGAACERSGWATACVGRPRAHPHLSSARASPHPSYTSPPLVYPSFGSAPTPRQSNSEAFLGKVQALMTASKGTRDGAKNSQRELLVYGTLASWRECRRGGDTCGTSGNGRAHAMPARMVAAVCCTELTRHAHESTSRRVRDILLSRHSSRTHARASERPHTHTYPTPQAKRGQEARSQREKKKQLADQRRGNQVCEALMRRSANETRALPRRITAQGCM